MADKELSAKDWSERWQAINQQVRCGKCRERDAIFKFIKCSECDTFFHKRCIQPFRSDEAWEADAADLICDDCAEKCMICGTDEDTEENPLIMCDNCDEVWHYNCLDDEERCPPEEIGDEEAEWYCPTCMEEYGSDMEWAEEHEVPEEEMTREECFTRSECPCKTCSEMNHAVDTWDDWKPENSVQQGMKDAIDAHQGLVNHVMDELHFRHGVPPPDK